MMRKKTILSTMLLLSVLLLPTVSHAAVEIQTYGNLDIIASAYKRVALIVSGTHYKTIFAGLAIFGFIGAGVTAIKMGMVQGRGLTLAAFVSPLIGIVLFGASIAQKEDMVFNDEVLARHTIVAEVPWLIARVAQVTNIMQDGVVNILDAAPAELGEVSYKQGGILSMDLSAAMAYGGIDTDGLKLLPGYIKTCVIAELERGGLTIEELLRPADGTNLIGVLGEAVNNAIYFGSGTWTGSCTEGYGIIKTALADVTAVQNRICAGYGVTPGMCNGLSTAINTGLQTAGLNVANADVMLANNAVAAITTGVLSNAGTADATVFSAEDKWAKGGISKGIVSSVINPRMIGVYAAYGVIMIPILLLFAGTPLLFRVISLCIGLAAWSAIAQIVDAVAYHMYQAEFIRAAASLPPGGWGIESAFNYQAFMGSSIGALGDLRSSVFLLATAISSILVKFGGDALAHVANSTKAEVGGTDTITPGAKGEAIKSVHRGAATDTAVAALAAGNGMSNYGRGAAANDIAHAADGLGKQNAAGGSATKLMSQQEQISRTNTAQAAGQADQFANTQEAYNSGAAGAQIRRTGQTDNGTNTVVTRQGSTGLESTEVAGAKILSQGGQVKAVQGSPVSGNLSNSLTQAATQSYRDAESATQVAAERLGQTFTATQGGETSLSNSKALSQFVANDKSAQSLLNQTSEQAKSEAKNSGTNTSEQKSRGTGTHAGVDLSALTGGVVGAGVNANTSKSTTTGVTSGTSESLTVAQRQARILSEAANDTQGKRYTQDQVQAARKILGFMETSTKSNDYSESAQRQQESARQLQQTKQVAANLQADGGMGAIMDISKQLYGKADAGAVTNTVARVAEMTKTPEGMQQLSNLLDNYGRSLMPKPEPLPAVDTAKLDQGQQAAAQTEQQINTVQQQVEGQTDRLQKPVNTVKPMQQRLSAEQFEASFDNARAEVGKARTDNLNARENQPGNVVSMAANALMPGVLTNRAPEFNQGGQLNPGSSDYFVKPAVDAVSEFKDSLGDWAAQAGQASGHATLAAAGLDTPQPQALANSNSAGGPTNAFQPSGGGNDIPRTAKESQIQQPRQEVQPEPQVQAQRQEVKPEPQGQEAQVQQPRQPEAQVQQSVQPEQPRQPEPQVQAQRQEVKPEPQGQEAQVQQPRQPEAQVQQSVQPEQPRQPEPQPQAQRQEVKPEPQVQQPEAQRQEVQPVQESQVREQVRQEPQVQPQRQEAQPEQHEVQPVQPEQPRQPESQIVQPVQPEQPVQPQRQEVQPEPQVQQPVQQPQRHEQVQQPQVQDQPRQPESQVQQSVQPEQPRQPESQVQQSVQPEQPRQPEAQVQQSVQPEQPRQPEAQVQQPVQQPEAQRQEVQPVQESQVREQVRQEPQVQPEFQAAQPVQPEQPGRPQIQPEPQPRPQIQPGSQVRPDQLAGLRSRLDALPRPHAAQAQPAAVRPAVQPTGKR